MNNNQIADQLSSRLELSSVPVALSFVEAAPEGVAEFEGAVPSACTFWRQAESGVFYASAEKHYNCPIGTMTMGFDMPDDVQQQLMGFVQMMTGCGYIALEEAAKIPSIKKRKNGIVYGPLKDFPIEPDMVLMWLTPRQAMLYSEAVGSCRWTEELQTAAFGRPACAALPVAFESSQPSLSLGCMGMRTFTDISEDRLLAVVPGSRLPEFINSLASIAEANAKMQTFYQGHKQQFAV